MQVPGYLAEERDSGCGAVWEAAMAPYSYRHKCILPLLLNPIMCRLVLL